MKILICCDGSEQAARAMRLGAQVADATEDEVTLFGVIEAPGLADPILDSLKRGQALFAEKKVRAELISKAGDPLREIIQRTRENVYDLVVIGAVRKEARGLFWMSSKSYKIIKAIQPPVLSVAGHASSVKKILICSGGKNYIDRAVRLTGRLARTAGASVTLLHVLPETPAIYARLPRIEKSTAGLLNSNSELGRNLRDEKQALESLGIPTEVRLPHGSVLEQILREINRGGYDLVVAGSGLSRGLRTYVLGDISREIVNRADSAVLVVRSEPKLEDSGAHFPFWPRRQPQP